MTDPRIEKLANLLINYSCGLKAGEKILIEAIDIPHTFTKSLVRAAPPPAAIRWCSSNPTKSSAPS